MYKRRRRATPALPTTSAEADAAVRSSRYAQLSNGEFYRGLAEAGENGSALLFASDAQLQLIRCATEIYFDATFKVVPTIYYQLFTCESCALRVAELEAGCPVCRVQITMVMRLFQ